MTSATSGSNEGILEYPEDYDQHIPDVSLPEFILEKIQSHGNELACVDAETGQQLTYADIGRITRHLAAGFESKWKLQVGTKVALIIPNCLEYPLIVMAVNLCGATAVLFNPSLTNAELSHMIKVTNPDYWIATEEFVPKFQHLYGSAASVTKLMLLGGDQSSGAASMDQMLRLGASQSDIRIPSMDYKEQIAMILFSSGTTGFPKGVALSHYNLVATRRQGIEITKMYPLVPGTKTVVTLPLYHIFGLSSMFDNFIRGLFFVLIPKFSLHVLLKAVQDHKITNMALVPAIAIQMAKQPVEKKYDLRSLRMMTVGAAPIGKEIMEKLAAKLKCRILQGYGMTESSLRSHSNLGTRSRIGSIGVTLPFCQSKVMDPETGRSLGPNQNGEICVRGPIVMKGYFGDEKSTSSTIDADGWLHTGDIGHYDDDGFFYITDRMKELIKYKGLQVAPSELEHVLLTHPDVVDAAVVGIPDEDSGELPRAYVIKRSNSPLTEEQVAKFVEGLVSAHKKLRGGVFFVKEIPRTKTGKIIRRQLKTLVSKL